MTTILMARAARFGNEKHELRLYDAFGGAREEFLGTMPLGEFCDVICLWAESADFVCVEETPWMVALVDMLSARGVTTLRSGGARMGLRTPMNAPIDRAALEVAIKWARGKADMWLVGTFPFENYSVLALAAEAHLETLPKTKMVEVWRMECAHLREGRWWPYSSTHICQADAEEHANTLRERSSWYVCIRVTGPHQQEVPA